VALKWGSRLRSKYSGHEGVSQVNSIRREEQHTAQRAMRLRCTDDAEPVCIIASH
jgi:hypothetical protein